MTTRPRYAEDFQPGQVHDLGTYEVTREETIEFAKRYDPFPFHTDEDAARRTPFGGLISSGWMTALIWLGMMHRTVLDADTALGSPGHEAMRWRTPVRPGDRLCGTLEVKSSRVSASKPHMGFVGFEATLRNQAGEEVFFTAAKMIVRTRPT